MYANKAQITMIRYHLAGEISMQVKQQQQTTPGCMNWFLNKSNIYLFWFL